MKNPFNPKWILIVTTFPSILLIILFLRSYSVIHTLLEPENLNVWRNHSILFLALSTGTMGYAIFQIIRRQKVSILYALIAFLVYLLTLYSYTYNMDSFIPENIPGWMVPENLTYYAGSFLMPSLLYSLILIAIWSLNNNQSQYAWYNLLYAVCIPVSIYVFANVVVPFWQPTESRFLEHSFVIFLVLATITFLFFILRWIYLVMYKRGSWDKNKIGFRLTLGIIFPLLGLAINNGLIGGPFHVGSGIFGDFNSPWFYGLALTNGLFLCLKPKENPYFMFARFVARSATYPFILYFFLVFMPYLPFSVLAIIVFGLGILMLTPTVLFIIQSNDLIDDYKQLKFHFSIFKLRFVSLAAMSIIPLGLTQSYMNDKKILTETLNSIYSPDFSKEVDINLKSLSATIKHIKRNRRQNDLFFESHHMPFLSSYFSWLVLDNMTLSNEKIRKIENIYFGTSATYTIPPPKSNEEVSISDIKSTSTYDPQQDAWESWIDLELTNNSTRRFAEYGTRIDLPVGCWINDYYLYVGDKKEMGILTEKKSAMWIYSQIRNQNRDPGILNYISGNEVAFRVFPFGSNQTRKTGIKFIHKEPVTIQIDNQIVTLGDNKINPPLGQSLDFSKNAVYISSAEKSTLPKIARTPYFHFIVDGSIGRESEIQKTIHRIKVITDDYPHLVHNAKVTFTNFRNLTFDLSDDWESKLEKHSFQGGFYLENAIKKILFNSYQSKSLTSPRIVVLSENLHNSVISKNFSDLKITFPENEFFYSVNSENVLVPHSLVNNPKRKVENHPIDLGKKEVYGWPDAINPSAFLSIDDNPSIVLKNSNHQLEKLDENIWEAALSLHGQWLSQCLHPEKSNERWIGLVKGSFDARILTPLTSFLVVENEAQKALLLRKQNQVLNGNKNLDLNGDVQSMSEPGTWVLLALFICVVLYKNRFSILKFKNMVKN